MKMTVTIVAHIYVVQLTHTMECFRMHGMSQLNWCDKIAISFVGNFQNIGINHSDSAIRNSFHFDLKVRQQRYLTTLITVTLHIADNKSIWKHIFHIRLPWHPNIPRLATFYIVRAVYFHHSIKMHHETCII